ncbi:MAG: hypothetical protein HY848_09860 [Betaproteobacteria bacterium]|nr:hypothetical protein [Betaproteobacteria bacterium]
MILFIIVGATAFSQILLFFRRLERAGGDHHRAETAAAAGLKFEARGVAVRGGPAFIL